MNQSQRLCVRNKQLNESTIKNRYPMPLVYYTLMKLSKARYYTKPDIRDTYNILYIAPGDEWKTVFGLRELL